MTTDPTILTGVPLKTMPVDSSAESWTNVATDENKTNNDESTTTKDDGLGLIHHPTPTPTNSTIVDSFAEFKTPMQNPAETPTEGTAPVLASDKLMESVNNALEGGLGEIKNSTKRLLKELVSFQKTSNEILGVWKELQKEELQESCRLEELKKEVEGSVAVNFG